MPITETVLETMMIERGKRAFRSWLNIPMSHMAAIADEDDLHVRFVPDLVGHLCRQVEVVLDAIVPVSVKEARTVSWPDGWWQALRERALPKRWLNKHPVRRRYAKLTIEINLRDVFEQLKRIPKDTDRPVTVVTNLVEFSEVSEVRM